jgi:polar amino acid transport system substrate-binding protein
METTSMLKFRFFILMVSFLPALLFSSIAHSQELTVQADRWCPYNCEPGSPAPGYVVEVLQAIFEGSGTKIRYQIVPWDRALMQTRDGNSDAAIGATQNEVNTFGLLIGSESVGNSSDCLYVAANNQMKFSKVDDLDTLNRIGVASGYNYSEEIDAWLKRPQNKSKVFVQKGEGPAETNARNLALGRLDGLIEDHYVMQQVIVKFGLEHKVILAGCQQQTKIFVAFSPKLKNATAMVKKFDDGMSKLRQSGRLSKILARYELIDWK